MERYRKRFGYVVLFQGYFSQVLMRNAIIFLKLICVLTTFCLPGAPESNMCLAYFPECWSFSSWRFSSKSQGGDFDKSRKSTQGEACGEWCTFGRGARFKVLMHQQRSIVFSPCKVEWPWWERAQQDCSHPEVCVNRWHFGWNHSFLGYVRTGNSEFEGWFEISAFAKSKHRAHYKSLPASVATLWKVVQTTWKPTQWLLYPILGQLGERELQHFLIC